MKQTKILWDMPITIEIVGSSSKKEIHKIYKYFEYIDQTFSTFVSDSEISKINKNLIPKEKYSKDMKEVLMLCEKTKKETNGYFDANISGKIDPLGLVKGWAVSKACQMLQNNGFKNFYIDAGGDIQTSGKNSQKEDWIVGIRNPFNRQENIKVIKLKNKGIATSGSYIRGDHIVSPKNQKKIKSIISLTVIGPNVYEADRFATAAFAMGEEGINFIASQKNLEGYMIDKNKIATYTEGFKNYEYN